MQKTILKNIQTMIRVLVNRRRKINMAIFDRIFKKEGYLCLYEKETKMFEQLDKDFVSFLNEYDVKRYSIPAMIDGNVLAKCNYFESFPHHLSSVSTVKENRLANVSANKIVTNEDLQTHNKFLTPAACLHIYPMLEGKKIQNQNIITKARVYRYEGNRYNETGRFWDYTVREMVFVGSVDYVRKMLKEIMDKTITYAKNITPKAKLVQSSDVFFSCKRNEIKKKLQLANEKKFEVIIPIDGEDVAVASFNFHGNHFSMPFHFDQKGSIVSGCVGFGLERWLLAKLFYEENKE